MKLKKSLAALLAATIAVSPAVADEGMWLLPFLKQQNSEQLKKAGLLVDIDDIYNPDSTSMKDAVVIFGGGCTGEIISPEGLILTNHHCGYDHIQAHSTVDNDLLTNGFWAKRRQEELPNPGLTVTFIDKIEEVTDYVEEELKKGESAEALTVEGQKPDAVIPYEENGKKWYFWYFTDLQSDKEGNELEYTLKQ